MKINWTPDKVKHYELCYRVVYRTPVVLNLLSFVLMLLAGLAKELVWDWLLGRGTPEIDDLKANWMGCWDGLLRR